MRWLWLSLLLSQSCVYGQPSILLQTPTVEVIEQWDAYIRFKPPPKNRWVVMGFPNMGFPIALEDFPRGEDMKCILAAEEYQQLPKMNMKIICLWSGE